MGDLSGSVLAVKALTGAPADDVRDGVMVALYPDAATADALALPGGLAPDELHVTIAYLGKVADVDRATLLAATQLVSQARPPVAATYSGLARFTNAGSDRGDALVALLDSPDLEQLRRDMVDALAAAGITPASEHGFTAHTTLGYLPADEPAPIERIEPRQVTFGALSAVVGEDSVDMMFAEPPGAEPVTPPAEAAPPAEAPPVETKLRFDRDTLPDCEWRTFRKTAPISATYIPRPFTVDTREGTVSSTGGWLAVDSKGWPYPIAVDELAAVYTLDVKSKPAFPGAATPFGSDSDAGPKIATGAFVALGNKKGRVDLVTTSGTVPGAKLPSGEDVQGSKASPAARVVEYEAGDGGTWKATGKKFASSVAKLRRIPPLRTRESKSLDEALAAILTAYYDHPHDALIAAEHVSQVYERGVKSWPGDQVTTLTSEQWGLGRVEAFVATATGQRPAGYHRDDDLLPRPAVPA